MNNGKICVSVCAETADAMIAKIKRADQYADIIEVRFDCLGPTDVDTLLKNLPEVRGKFLFTFRPHQQGGKRELTLEDRLRFWGRVLSFPVRDLMIDIECEPALLLAVEPHSIVRIVSHHDLDGIPDDPDSILGFASTLHNSIAKIAGRASDISDCIPLWKLLDRAKESGQSVIPIAMGEAGKWTRILGLAYGGGMTYGSLDIGDETAPGQLTARDLRDVYRVQELDQDTEVYGVIGNPVSESLSPYIHNPAFVSAGVNAVFIPLMVGDIDAFMRRMVHAETREIDLNFRGFSVTMPHKLTIMSYLDEIDPTAKAIGAVNTVKIENGRSIGFNTDADGFILPLKKHVGDLNEIRVAVLGAGGAARACVFALKREGADATVFARDLEKATSLGEEFGVNASALSGFKPEGFDIVVNATPVGMSGVNAGESLLTAAQLKGVRFVYDLVTSTEDTPLVREARKAGIKAIGGIEMLIAQAAKQFEIWTGKTADVELMSRAALERLNQK